MADLITLRSYDNYITANIVKSKLEAEGVLCVLKDEHTVAMQWVWSHAIGGIKLQVAEQDEEKALHILETTEEEARLESETPGFWDEDTEQLDPNNKICIHCGSKNTRKVDFNKGPTFLSWLLLGFPLLFRSDKWHCFHCGEEF